MDTTGPNESAAPAGGREWLGLAVLALPTLLLSLDMSVMYLALPHISTDLATTSTETLWVMDIYGFMIAGFLITMGTLGDRIGRRKLLLIGAAAFGVASVLAAYSVSAEMLIATRALLGIAGATLMPSTLALISNMFADPKQRGLAVGVWMSCFMVGWALGPVVGGAMLELFWWGAVFLLGVPVMLVLLAAGPLLLPEYRDPEGGRLDLTSVSLSLAAILPIIYGLKELAKAGPDAVNVIAIVAGLAFGVVFVLRQRKLASPLLDLRLFSNRTVRSALAISLLATVTMGGTTLLVNMYLQEVAGLSPLQAGLWIVPSALCAIAGNMVAPVLTRRIRPAYVVAGSLVLSAVGLVLLMRAESVGGLAMVVAGYTIAFGAISPTGAVNTDLVVGSAPPEKAGSAASLSETTGEFGISLGVAILGSIGLAVYRGQVHDTVPSGVPADVADATRETITGATAAADRLPDPVGNALIDPAREAFTSGLNVVTGISAAAVIAFALLSLVTLRHVRPSGARAEQGDAADGGEPTIEAADSAPVGTDDSRRS
ncbi:MFS transporter [Amycolatopsis anabasis]|uniref:MFS transporter n=1 Tax=Amycolatopsis anabasis TaxID=1840409 RepID=UPI00131BCDE2|nr:MFS transporter [Amycolatopsis anabasis]